mgnify:CR=1 FL=1
MKAQPYEQRDKNVFFKTPEFKARIIELPPNGIMPECEMASYVVFIVIEGEAAVTVNQKQARLQAGQCLITEPATLSMNADTGVKIIGIQITKANDE